MCLGVPGRIVEVEEAELRFGTVAFGGIRKRVKTASGHEYYASLRTATAMERAEVAVLVIDGSQSISEQDMRIIQTVRDSGRALVIAGTGGLAWLANGKLSG